MATYELYKGEVELEFDEKKHTYTVGAANIPSVTGVTSIIDKSGALMWWAVRECLDFVKSNFRADLDEVESKDFYHQAQRAYMRSSQTAKDIGTLAHQWIEDYFNGKSPEMPVNPKLRSTIESFMEWAAENKVYPYQLEFKVYSRKHGYAGTCDFDGMINGERCVADWKTGKAVYPEHRLQTMAYLLAREEELGHKYDARWVVVLPKEGGKVIAKRFGRKQNKVDRKGFLGALDLYRALKDKGESE